MRVVLYTNVLISGIFFSGPPAKILSHWRKGNFTSANTIQLEQKMPEICRFFGIIIAMFFADHNPPHFHARYGSEKATIEIETLRIIEGNLPPRALGLVIEWAAQHKEELLQNWELTKNGQAPKKIEPLK